MQENLEYEEPVTPGRHSGVPSQSQSNTTSSGGGESNTDSSASSGSSEPRKLRPLTEVYDTTHDIELSDELIEELMFLGVEEPVNYNQAAVDTA